MHAQHISMAGPGKRGQELKQAIAADITINVESTHQLETIAALSEQTGIPANVAIRINPRFELKNSSMKMGGGPKQSGIDEELLPTVLKRTKALNLKFQGFHIYSYTQNLKTDPIIESQQQCINLALELAEYCPTPVKKLNVGGGYGIPYFPGESPVDTQRIGDALAKTMDVCKAGNPQADVIIELGRYLEGEARLYVCQIVDKKISRGQFFL